MVFWNRWFGRKEDSPPETDDAGTHCVLIHLLLAAQWPSDDETSRYHALQDELEKRITDAGAGELDGDEWGEGECTIFLYGPDADRLWAAVAPVLSRHRFPPGSWALKRFGGPDCERTERVQLGTGG